MPLPPRPPENMNEAFISNEQMVDPQLQYQQHQMANYQIQPPQMPQQVPPQDPYN